MTPNITSLVQRIPDGGATIVTPEEAATLRERCAVVRTEDTRFNGLIHVLRTDDDELILAEQTLDRQPVIRRVESLAEAEEIIRSRLEIYDRMWDGCGCKVDFFGTTSCKV